MCGRQQRRRKSHIKPNMSAFLVQGRSVSSFQKSQETRWNVPREEGEKDESEPCEETSCNGEIPLVLHLGWSDVEHACSGVGTIEVGGKERGVPGTCRRNDKVVWIVPGPRNGTDDLTVPGSVGKCEREGWDSMVVDSESRDGTKSAGVSCRVHRLEFFGPGVCGDGD